MKKIVIALGGNAILKKGQKGTIQEQWENVRKVATVITEVIRRGHKVILTHGNGPQVGNILEMMDAVAEKIPPMTMDVAGAMTQGWIGYLLQQALTNELRRKGIDKKVVTIVTQTIVDGNDPAFQNPTKYVGPYYEEEAAKKLIKEKGWIMKPDPRGGWRRVVPSPDPRGHVEAEVIKKLVDEGYIVISSGGGGIPVIYDKKELKGVEAVIDKDLAGERLATSVQADIFVILTDVDGAMLNFNTPNQKLIKEVRVDELETYYREGHFKPGSMGPKVLACIRFLRNGGKRAAIGHLDKALDVIEGREGTQVYP